MRPICSWCGSGRKPLCANGARQGFELFRAFWRWCATHKDYQSVVDPTAVESKDLRQEVPSRKTKRFDVLERGQLPAWFKAVRALKTPTCSAYLQGLLLTGARREEMAALRWDDVDFQWGSLWLNDKVAEEGRKVPLTPYLASLLDALPLATTSGYSAAQPLPMSESLTPESRITARCQ